KTKEAPKGSRFKAQPTIARQITPTDAKNATTPRHGMGERQKDAGQKNEGSSLQNHLGQNHGAR
ncbi:MAG: hypothetical protein AB1705_25855, partial [Verrucomicrobiota bacterium]